MPVSWHFRGSAVKRTKSVTTGYIKYYPGKSSINFINGVEPVFSSSWLDAFVAVAGSG